MQTSHPSLSRQQSFALIWAILPFTLIAQVNGLYTDHLAKYSKTLFWSVDFLQWIFIPLITVYLLAKRVDIPPKHYGFDRSKLWLHTPILDSIAIFATAGTAFFLAKAIAWTAFGHPTGAYSIVTAFPTGFFLSKLVWLYTGITAGIVESIFFIGLPWLLYRTLSNNPSATVFTLIITAYFAASHWEQGPHIIAAAFCCQLILCAWYFRRGNLWAIAAGHTLIDLFAFY